MERLEWIHRETWEKHGTVQVERNARVLIIPLTEIERIVRTVHWKYLPILGYYRCLPITLLLAYESHLPPENPIILNIVEPCGLQLIEILIITLIVSIFQSSISFDKSEIASVA